MSTRKAIHVMIGSAALLAATLYLLGGADSDKVLQEQLLRHRNLGKAFYENTTTYAQAVEEFRKALELAPKSLRERLNYGLALLRTMKMDEGVAELEKVQRDDPAIPHTWFNLGIVYKKRGEYDRAIQQFERMVRLVPDEPISHYNLGVLYRYTGRTEDALRELELASTLDPNFAAPLFQTFDIFREAERAADAERALERFQVVKKRQEGPDAAAEDTNWSFYSEIYETIEAREDRQPPAAVRLESRRLAGKADPATAGLLVLDSMGAGRADLLVWSSAGVQLYRGGSEPLEAGLSKLRGVVSVVAGDYNNDGFPDLCIVAGDGPALYLNRNGSFAPQAAVLPSGRFRKALWHDYDHDYDPDLLLFGGRTVLLRNQGQAGFQDRSADLPFPSGEAIDAVAIRLIPDTKALDLVISYAGRPGVLLKDRLAGLYEARQLDSVPAGSVSLAAFDFDNDSWIDLGFRNGKRAVLLRNKAGSFEAVSGSYETAGNPQFADLETRGVADLITSGGVFRNLGLGRFDPASKPSGFAGGAALAEADFDRDGRTDLASVAADGSVNLLLNRTVSDNRWLSATLTGVKAAKLASGSEVEVKSGFSYQKRLYEGVPLTFGLGANAAVDTVRITWPNGMIQNETRQAANQFAQYKEAPRLSGSCPMIYTWNGQQFEFLTDVLGVAPLGASSGDGNFFPVDHDEYVQIPSSSLAARDGRLDLRITEELAEVSYLDQVRLIAVDHPAATEIFSNDKWKSPPFPEFRLFGVERRIYPAAARDDRGRDLTGALRLKDRRYAGPVRRDYRGVAERHALELDFGPAAPDNRAVLVLNGWVDWADGSTFLAASQEGNGLQPPYLQVKDAQGRWRTVIEDMGMPSGKTKTIAVDLTGRFLSASRQVRIVTNLCVYWDEIFLGEDSAEPEARLTPLDASQADLRFRGYSRRVIHAQRKQPEYFDYARVLPASNWNATPGLYTRYGEVRELLESPDDRMVIMGSGDELKLSFDAAALPPLPRGWRRQYLLKVDGWAKDRDANTADSQTVEPLPFHKMSSYPYPATERYPDGPEHERYRRKYLTRPALRLLGSLTSGSSAPVR